MKRVSIGLFVISLLLAGCGTNQKPAAGAPALPGLLPAAATATPADVLASSPADITGIWKGTWAEGGTGYLAFKPDGSFGYGPQPDGSKGLTGTYSFDGTKLTLRVDQQMADCGPLSGGYYQVRLKKSGGTTTAIQFMYVDDICQPRVKILTVDTTDWTKP